ncbi:hypothetical protein D9756_006877 [Leucocoprinus leucothites]|uniref:Uncharacterized protein n=1 Tax=Leucocoprinus leucothites TaxID=201217 RepID=A0A8H5D6E3_9AGAR|nr:hypothetical protein D9756_006877 [Leucoagaricus leucothites]
MFVDTANTLPQLRPQASRSSYASSLKSTSNVLHRTSTPAGTHLRLEGYTAVDPYEASISHSIINLHSREDADSSLEDIDVPEQYSVHQFSMLTNSVATGLDETKHYSLSDYILAFIIDTLPRLIYSYFLLRLPSLYFSRVARVFEDAELTMPEIKRMALELANARSENVHQALFTSLSTRAPETSPFWTLKSSWETFIESLLREWKTLNIISVLLLSAILTILQIDSAANDPLTRYSALSSLVCALMSLLYGCIFIIRFGSMKKPHKAAEWAWEARKMRTVIWWNVWVMLAMPAIWLSWSIVSYIVCIMSFLWRTGSTLDGSILPLTPELAFWPRLVISLMLALGVVYFVLITMTLRHYGSTMDRKWRERVKGWTDRLIYEQPFPEHIGAYANVINWGSSAQNSTSRKNSDDSSVGPFISSTRFVSRSPSPIGSPHELTNRAGTPVKDAEAIKEVLSPVQTFRAIELWYQNVEISPLPAELAGRNISEENWAGFTEEVAGAWNTPTLPTPQASVLRILSTWNANVFAPLHLEVVLCQEYYPEWPESPLYTIYITDRRVIHGRILPLEERFGKVPFGLIRIDVLDFSYLRHNWLSLFPPRGTEVHFNFHNSSSPPTPEQSHQRSTGFQAHDSYDDRISNESDRTSRNATGDHPAIDDMEDILLTARSSIRSPSTRFVATPSPRPSRQPSSGPDN